MHSLLFTSFHWQIFNLFLSMAIEYWHYGFVRRQRNFFFRTVGKYWWWVIFIFHTTKSNIYSNSSHTRCHRQFSSTGADSYAARVDWPILSVVRMNIREPDRCWQCNYFFFVYHFQRDIGAENRLIIINNKWIRRTFMTNCGSGFLYFSRAELLGPFHQNACVDYTILNIEQIHLIWTK